MYLLHRSISARKDLRDIFDQLSVTRKAKIVLSSEKSRSAPELCHFQGKRKIGLLTRNNSLDLEITESKYTQKRIFDEICSASILTNCAGLDISNCNNHVITLTTLKKFLEVRQMEIKSEEDLKLIIQVQQWHLFNPLTLLKSIYISSASRAGACIAFRELLKF